MHICQSESRTQLSYQLDLPPINQNQNPNKHVSRTYPYHKSLYRELGNNEFNHMRI